MPKLPYSEIHAFPDGDRRHTGNPAGVSVLDAPMSEADMQGIALSNNLSETAYLTALDEEDAWNLRWFTPSREVDLCGHATLASGAYVFEEGMVKGDTAKFDTRSGRLSVQQVEQGRYAVNFPVVKFEPADAAPGTIEGMGLAPKAVFEVERIHGSRYQMFVYETEAQIADLAIDESALAATGTNILATARGQSADVVSRFFCPADIKGEDPVTGSAHCTLAPYWADVLGKNPLSARQIGPRSGALTMSVGEDGRVTLIGAAHRHLDGVIHL